MYTKSKKSAVDLTELALAIIVLGVVVSVGSTILIKYRDSRLDDSSQFTVANEKLVATDSGTTLTTQWVNSITSVTNSTDGSAITSPNYTLSVDSGSGTGTITFIGTSTYNGTNVNVTYTNYNTSDPQFAIPNNASAGLSEYGNWFTVLVIVGIAAVVLSLIFLAFSGGRAKGSVYGGGGSVNF